MKNLILIFALAVITISCDRNNAENSYHPQLPPVTTTGANTFGCKINGVVMVPRNSIGYVPPGSNHYAVDNLSGLNFEYEYIWAADKRETNTGGVFIYFQNIPPTGNPVSIGTKQIHNGIVPSFLNDNYNNYLYVTAYKNGSPHNYISIESSGTIEIIKSDIDIISGTFSCKAKNINDPSDIIQITEGRFDINRTTINTINFP